MIQSEPISMVGAQNLHIPLAMLNRTVAQKEVQQSLFGDVSRKVPE
jgi:hypothetical protein